MTTFARAAVLLVSAAALHAEVPLLEPAILIEDGGGAMRVGWCCAPCVVDWNRDGAKDLLVTDVDCGEIYAFLNRGTDAAPVFAGGEVLTSDGVPIVTAFG